MKVAVDAGALCSKSHFGTYTFTENLINALQNYHKTNTYNYYSFCPIKKNFQTVQLPKKLFRFWGILEDVVLALNQLPPIFCRGKIISFCHGLSYHFYPQYYCKKDVIRLKKQLREMIRRSDIIVVSSQKIKKEFVSIYRYIDTKILVIPFGIPYDMENKSKVLKSIKPKAIQKYFLYVGMDHAIKNIEFIKKAFSEFKKDKNFGNYQLKIITQNIGREDLRKLYQNATGLLTASYYESFNFPALEALVNDCPVIALSSAIIPELKEFVNICDNNINDFALKMKKVCGEKQRINQKKIREIFNWKNYVNKLCQNYQR